MLQMWRSKQLSPPPLHLLLHLPVCVGLDFSAFFIKKDEVQAFDNVEAVQCGVSQFDISFFPFL
jgi:hypothetical protein